MLTFPPKYTRLEMPAATKRFVRENKGQVSRKLSNIVRKSWPSSYQCAQKALTAQEKMRGRWAQRRSQLAEQGGCHPYSSEEKMGV